MLPFNLKSSICTYVSLYFCLYFMKRSMCNLHFTVNSVQSFSPPASRNRFFLIPVLHSVVCIVLYLWTNTSHGVSQHHHHLVHRVSPTDRSTANNSSYCNLLIQYFVFNTIKRNKSIDRNHSTDRNLPSSTSLPIRIITIARTIVADWIPPHFVMAVGLA
jgi:hypothetical protein